MTTIFDFDCPACGRALQPEQGCRWHCRDCETTYEACGCYLVELHPSSARCCSEVVDVTSNATSRRDPSAVS